MNKFVQTARSLLIALIAIVHAGCGNEEPKQDELEKKCTTEERYLVVTPYAGMANRLRVLASAKIMAAVTDRKLVVDWGVSSNELPGKWADFFLTPMTMFENSDLAQTCSLKSITEASEGDPVVKNLGSKNDAKSQGELAKIPSYNEPVIYFGTSLNFWPEDKVLSQAEYQDRFKIFYQNLDPTLWVANSVKQYKKDKKFDDKFMVGVHYRGWQTSVDSRDVAQVDLSNKYINLFIDEMKRAVNQPETKTGNKPVAFFLAADNDRVKQTIMATPELKDRVFTRTEDIDRSTIRGQESALVDWFLLASTEYVIGTFQSSFSDEAARLTRQGRKQNLGQAAYSTSPP